MVVLRGFAENGAMRSYHKMRGLDSRVPAALRSSAIIPSYPCSSALDSCLLGRIAHQVELTDQQNWPIAGPRSSDTCTILPLSATMAATHPGKTPDER